MCFLPLEQDYSEPCFSQDGPTSFFTIMWQCKVVLAHYWLRCHLLTTFKTKVFKNVMTCHQVAIHSCPPVTGFSCHSTVVTCWLDTCHVELLDFGSHHHIGDIPCSPACTSHAGCDQWRVYARGACFGHVCQRWVRFWHLMYRVICLTVEDEMI